MYEIEDFVNFLKLEKKYSQHTCSSYYSDLSQAYEYFELTVDQFSRLTDLDYSLLRNFIVYLSSLDLNPRTINRKVSALRRFYSYFLSKSVIDSHPLGNHKALKQPKKVSVPFSEDEIQNLFNHFNHSYDSDTFEKLRDRLIVELLYTLGVRRSELMGIRDRDLDTSARTVRIYGKGGKERLLPLLPSTVGLIKEYVDKRGIKFNTSTFSSLLVTDKGQELYPKFVYRKINDYLKGVSVKQKKSPHTTGLGAHNNGSMNNCWLQKPMATSYPAPTAYNSRNSWLRASGVSPYSGKKESFHCKQCKNRPSENTAST